MRGQAERLFLCRPPHHRLRRSRLGGARSDAASGHGFCPQWQKPQFAARAHHTVVMRITRGSPPKGKPSSSLASPVQGEVDCRRQDGRVVVPAHHLTLQPSRLASLGTLPYTGRARGRYYNALLIQFCSSANPLLNPATIAGFSFIQKGRSLWERRLHIRLLFIRWLLTIRSCRC